MAITLNGTTGITTPALDSEGNLEYSGTLTGGTGVVNIGSGQVYKDASGNVGIGTSTVARGPLHINQNSTSDCQIHLTNNTSGTGGADGFTIYSTGLNAGFVNREASGYINFLTNNAGSVAEAARIDSSRNLLVGTTSSAINNADDGITANVGGGGETFLGIRHDSTAVGGNYFIGFSYNGTVIGNVAQNGTTGVSYNTSSDYRLKENLVPIPDALTRVSAIPVYRFNFIADPDKTVDGFVAHELAAHVPEAVTGEKDAVETVEIKDDEGNVTGTEERPVYQGVDQSKVVPLLTAAIQEQQTLIQALTARIEVLEQA